MEIGPEKRRNQTKLYEDIPEFDLGIITLPEVKAYIKRTKRRKAPGPDEVPIEFFKEMDDEAKNFPIITKTEKDVNLNSVMSNSFGFGGTNATLIFEKI